jgi:excisionase family DNA binding protein
MGGCIMLKEKMLPISIFCLAISIIISASILTKGMKNNGEYVGTGLGVIGHGLNNISSNLNPYNNNQGIPKDNYSSAEAAIYLRISENKLMQLVSNKGSGIPYVKIGSDYIFNKNALDKWLETAKIEVQ